VCICIMIILVFLTHGGYIYFIYTPNLGLDIAVAVREKEQGRSKGSSKGARGSAEGALREQRRSKREQEGAL